ncbi:hypothetical protein ABLE94_21900 [Gordonia sp. VNK1]|uniref:hypothetical protein n=1 Tax=Gordonia oleivorans TaxID=3156618 RepID=UPI0032B3D82A
MADDRRVVAGLELDPGFAASLRKIERKVLAEVPLRPRSVRVIWTTIVVLAAATVTAWITSDADGVRTILGEIAIGLGVAGALMSTVAVTLRRFGWCWVASAISAIAVPLSVLGYWSTQTGLGVASVGFLVAALAHAVLVGNWVQCGRPPQPGPGK